MTYDQDDNNNDVFDNGNMPFDAADKETRQWAMFLHFSVFAVYVVPVAGLLAPILIWQLKKEELPGIDIHGKNVVNFMITTFIFLVISAVSCFFIIGFLMLIVELICAIVFPIIGGIKANEGEIWEYPMVIKFL